MSASSQGGRKGRARQATDYETRRDETRGTAPQAQAQTQGQHGHEWSAKHRQGQGRACTIDGRGKPSRIHPLQPSHTPSGPSQPRSTSASQANATPAGTRSLAAKKCHPRSQTKAILRPPGNQIKSNSARCVERRQAGRQADRQTSSSCSCAHASTPPRDELTRPASIHPYIHTRGYMQQFNLYTV